MIEAITFDTAHLLGDVLPSMLRLRHRVFVDRQRYQVPTFNRMEWNQFDTPAAVYLVWRDESAAVRAVARLVPTTFPYMIKEIWPELVEERELACRPDVWELSRLGIDRGIPSSLRQRILGEMTCACAEFAALNGIRSYLLVSHPHLIKTGIADAGWQTDLLSEPRQIGHYPVIAAKIHMTIDGFRNARRHYGIPNTVLRIVGEEQYQDQAA
ncbi:MAG: hypothetical protein H6905_01910 [Hyphomicrobiales bacterium]|nr:hypothetical protein [Hyphomicrobiales bacterium]